jgi:hypothetical protein
MHWRLASVLVATDITSTKAPAGIIAVAIVALGVLILTAMVACPATAQGQDAQLQEATQLTAQGWALLQQGRYPDAELLFKQTLAIREMVAEQARGGAAQASLAKAAVRSAASDPTTAALARQVQDFDLKRSAIEKQLVAEYAKPAGQQNEDRLRNLQQLSHSRDDQLATATDQLYKNFPKYREITAPDPITIPDARALLRADEALISYCTLGDRVLIWLVRPGAQFVYRDTTINRADFDAAVWRVRRSLAADKPYDVADAYTLYKVLLEPFKAHFAGVKNLIIVPDAALLPVPFAALVTSDQGRAYAALADDYCKGLPPFAGRPEAGVSAHRMVSEGTLRAERASLGDLAAGPSRFTYHGDVADCTDRAVHRRWRPCARRQRRCARRRNACDARR